MHALLGENCSAPGFCFWAQRCTSYSLDFPCVAFLFAPLAIFFFCSSMLVQFLTGWSSCILLFTSDINVCPPGAQLQASRVGGRSIPSLLSVQWWNWCQWSVYHRHRAYSRDRRLIPPSIIILESPIPWYGIIRLLCHSLPTSAPWYAIVVNQNCAADITADR